MCSFEIQYAKAMEYYEQIKEASDFLKSRIPTFIKDAVILGTGLGDFVESVDIEDEIPYGEIPNFPVSTVESHDGKLIVGTIKNKRIIVFSGRFHYYEGYSMKELTLPIRVLAMMGVENLFLTNVSGGINEDFEAGDLVMIKDHINMMPENPLRGPNDDRLGPRFPDMKNTYSEVFCNKALSIAKRLNLQLKSGIYYALQGPNLETPAEYKMVHTVGADLVGMSTVPEIIVAKHAGLNIFAVSIVSNVCFPIERITETSLEEVIEIAHQSGSKLSLLLTELLQ